MGTDTRLRSLYHHRGWFGDLGGSFAPRMLNLNIENKKNQDNLIISLSILVWYGHLKVLEILYECVISMKNQINSLLTHSSFLHNES